MIEHIISLIAPHKCVGCDREGSLLCDPCGKTLGINNERCKKCGFTFSTQGCVCFAPIAHAYAATQYGSLPRQLVGRLKFDRAKSAAGVIATLCAPLVPPEATIISHVPTANSRVRTRGYDQSRLIARGVAQYCNKPMVPLLARTSETRQVGSTAEVRRSQLKEAFRTTALPVIAGSHVVLIDDVLTTGSTVQAAAKVLLQNGAARVDSVVFSIV